MENQNEPDKAPRDIESLLCGFDIDEILTMDGYDHCIVGVVEQFGRPPIACYDKQRVLDELMTDGMSEEDAEEFWEFNQIGAYVGEATPCFITLNTQSQTDPGDPPSP